MKSRLLALAIACIWCISIQAQVNQYSYISDRTFTSPEQLMGYDFKPAMKEIPGEQPEEFKVGTYSFGITRKNLYVEGPEIRGVYSVNNINTTEYGFQLMTMNARDPTIQGHLKIVVDEIGQVEGLIFKRSTHEKEVIFFLRVIPKEVEEVEEKYFTNKGSLTVPDIDTLWTGVEIRPFLRIFKSNGGVQQRIIPSDSMFLKFYKVITVEEKERKKFGMFKKKKKKKKEEKQEQEQTEKEEPTANNTVSDSLRTDSLENPLEPVVKELSEAEKKLIAKQDSAIKAQQAIRDSLIAINPLNKYDSLTIATGIDTARNIKIKIITKYYVDLSSFMRYTDGSSGMEYKTYQINGVVERENTHAKPGGNRFQWELNLHKQPNAYIYLDEKKRVNSVYIDGQEFFMRGH